MPVFTAHMRLLMAIRAKEADISLTVVCAGTQTNAGTAKQVTITTTVCGHYTQQPAFASTSS